MNNPYVKVDEDGDYIAVYVDADEDDRADVELFYVEDYGTVRNTRIAAEARAQRLAKELGCDWGSNY